MFVFLYKNILYTPFLFFNIFVFAFCFRSFGGGEQAMSLRLFPALVVMVRIYNTFLAEHPYLQMILYYFISN